jgi:hypothetical protein
MDMTVWLEYFVEGLATQLREVQERGELVIRRALRDYQPATTAWAAMRTGGKVIASIMHGPPCWYRSDNPCCGRRKCTARSPVGSLHLDPEIPSILSRCPLNRDPGDAGRALGRAMGPAEDWPRRPGVALGRGAERRVSTAA